MAHLICVGLWGAVEGAHYVVAHLGMQGRVNVDKFRPIGLLMMIAQWSAIIGAIISFQTLGDPLLDFASIAGVYLGSICLAFFLGRSWSKSS